MQQNLNYYNDNDPFCVKWLQNLVQSGKIPKGDVDGRSIADVTAEEVRQYTQCHFFAGIGGWPRALELAGWNPAIPVWTGSVPCQPLSSAGQRKGAEDERHLWPEFYRLIRECRPPIVFGEQVASKDGREWLNQPPLSGPTLLGIQSQAARKSVQDAETAMQSEWRIDCARWASLGTRMDSD